MVLSWMTLLKIQEYILFLFLMIRNISCEKWNDNLETKINRNILHKRLFQQLHAMYTIILRYSCLLWQVSTQGESSHQEVFPPFRTAFIKLFSTAIISTSYTEVIYKNIIEHSLSDLRTIIIVLILINCCF